MSSPTGGEEQRTGPLTPAMRDRLRRGGWGSRYRLRKETVEPVFGQIEEARGFRRFLHRGLVKVQAEWRLVCTAHNVLKLAARRGRAVADGSRRRVAAAARAGAARAHQADGRVANPPMRVRAISPIAACTNSDPRDGTRRARSGVTQLKSESGTDEATTPTGC